MLQNLRTQPRNFTQRKQKGRDREMAPERGNCAATKRSSAWCDGTGSTAVTPHQADPRLRFGLLLAAGGVTASELSLMFSFVASAKADCTCRLTCEEAAPRIEPTMRLAVLSHMLMNGFFFNQGCVMSVLAEKWNPHSGLETERDSNHASVHLLVDLVHDAAGPERKSESRQDDQGKGSDQQGGRIHVWPDLKCSTHEPEDQCAQSDCRRQRGQRMGTHRLPNGLGPQVGRLTQLICWHVQRSFGALDTFTQAKHGRQASFSDSINGIVRARHHAMHQNNRSRRSRRAS
jgi:hypothetical protein